MITLRLRRPALALAGALLCAGLGLAACTPSPPTAGAQAAGIPILDAAKEAANDRARAKAEAMIGKPIPPFRLALAGGGTLTEADLKGKWTVLDFWGIWCPDCMVDLDNVAALAAAVKQDPDLRVIGVHVDKRTGRWASVAEFMAEKGSTHPVMLDPDRALFEKLGLGWVPTFLVVDPEGVVRGYRNELHRDRSPEGGVKAFIKQIADLRSSAAR
jgi:peroxiredoxin